MVNSVAFIFKYHFIHESTLLITQLEFVCLICLILQTYFAFYCRVSGRYSLVSLLSCVQKKNIHSVLICKMN